MWENSELKQRAKQVLSRFGYWTPFGATILCGLLMTDPGNILSVISENPELENALYGNEEIATFVTFAVPLLVLLSFLFNVFVGYPVLVGMNRFFMENRVSGSKVERIFWVFKSGNYLNVVKTMFLMNLKIFLWSLLLFIPGIIKSYQYYMIPYILAENPGIDSRRAFELSKEMTDGDLLYCILQMALDGEEELARLCPQCRSDLLQEGCPVCGAVQYGMNPNFDPARFEELKSHGLSDPALA
jgi:uncharacterized membrane protein